MGVGGLAVIIPPSALTVLLATLGQTDVGALLIAGVIPGLILATMYGVLIWAWTVIDPSAAPADVAPNAVEVYVGYLRRKITGLPLVTVRGAGYRLVT